MSELIGKTVGVERRRIEDLKPHPRNAFFFPEGIDEELLSSIKAHGLIEAPIIATDNTIISGHRRIAALKELGVKETLCQIREYSCDDAMVYDLLTTNITGRGGVAGLPPVYVGRIVYEISRLNGALDAQTEPIVGDGKTQAELRDELGLSRSGMRRALQANNVNVPLQDEMMERGVATSEHLVEVSRLTSEQQEILQQVLEENKLEKMSPKKLRDTIQEIINRAAEADDLERRLEKQTQRATMFADAARKNDIGEEIEARLKAEADLNRMKALMMSAKDKALQQLRDDAARIEELERQIKNASNTPEVVEVMPEDYEQIKAENAELLEKIERLSSYDALLVAVATNVDSIGKVADTIQDDDMLACKMASFNAAATELQEYIRSARKGVA